MKKQHGGRRPNQTGRPRKGDEPTRPLPLRVPASLRQWYDQATPEQRERARVAMVEALRQAQIDSEG